MEQLIFDSATLASWSGMGIVLISFMIKGLAVALGKYWGFALYVPLGCLNIVYGMTGWQTDDWFVIIWHPILGIDLLYFWLFVICGQVKRRAV